MLKKEYLHTLKTLKMKYRGQESIIEAFPILLAESCTNAYIIDISTRIRYLGYDYTKLMEFKNNFGICVINENYELLANLIIEFFKSYNYKILTKDYKYLMFPINFPKEAEDTFIKACNNFKGKMWDDILDDLLEALCIFLNTGTVNGQTLK